MKILRKIGIFILITLMIFTLTSITKINTLASQILNNNSRKPVNPFLYKEYVGKANTK